MKAPVVSDEIALENRVHRIEQRTLGKVFYQRTPFAALPEEWATDAPHPVESVYLQTEDGHLFRIFWADEFHLRHGFGVSMVELKVIDRDRGPVEDVSACVGWRSLVGRRIATSTVHWREIKGALRSTFRIALSIHADHLSRWDYPQTIELAFDDGKKKFFDASNVLENGEVVQFTNHLLVT